MNNTTRLIAFAVIFLSLITASHNVYSQGKKLTSPEGHFSVMLPEGFSEPEKSDNPIKMEDSSEVMIHMYSSYNLKGEVFLVSYNEYPELFFNKDFQKTMLDNVRDGAIGNMKGVIEKEKDFKFEGSPSRTVYFSAETDGKPSFNRFQCIIAKPRLYQLIYIGYNKKDRDAKKITELFKSFRITK